METAELNARVKGFGKIEPDRVIAEDELFIIVKDKFPLSRGHTLIIVKRIVARFRELSADEKSRLMKWIDWSIGHLEESLTPKPDGFNIGLNDGPAAGQTVPQLHVHVIPRYEGDVADPRGGVRWIFPEKAPYWKS